MVNVPASYVPLLQGMSTSTGIPYNIEAAQAFVESHFTATAVSPAGAEGWLQFLPSTYDEFTGQAGVAQGTEFNPTDEAKVYDAYMGSLLSTYHGDIRSALAAYNAGDPASPAGQQYATQILSLAGSPDVTVTSGGGVTPTTTAATGPFPGGNLDPFNWIWGLFGGAQHAAQQGINDLLGQTLQLLGGVLHKAWADLWAKEKPTLIRLGLILLGVLIVYAGIQGFLRPSAGPSQIVVETAKEGVKQRQRATTKS